METYVEVIDFTPAGAYRFTAFLLGHARPDVNPDAYRLECLGVLEEQINGGAPAVWTLPASLAVNGEPAEFIAADDDLILDPVKLP